MNLGPLKILNDDDAQAAYAKAEKTLQEERATLTRFDNELKELANVIKEKKHAVSQAELDVKGLDHEVQVLSKDRTTAVNHAANLERQCEWIQVEKECVFFVFVSCMGSGLTRRGWDSQFGEAGTQYDFGNLDIGRMKEKARELEESQKGMKKKINTGVLNMIDG